MAYPELEFYLIKRGIKRQAVAEALGISVKSVTNKVKGRVPFTWPEACALQRTFFPDVGKDVLFSTEEESNKAS